MNKYFYEIIIAVLVLGSCAQLAWSDQVNYYSPDDGQLTIIDNAEDVRVVIDQNGTQNLEIMPSNDGQTFVYGDELTVIDTTSFGVISY